MHRIVVALIVLAICITPCFAEEAVDHLQIAVFAPVQVINELDSLTGLRLNLIYGRNAGFKGLDLGLVNWTEGDWKGVGVGAMNYTKWFGRGAQIACYNRAREFTGLQFGFVNRATEVRGVQFGFANYATDLAGLQIGFVNVISEREYYSRKWFYRCQIGEDE